MGNLYLGNSGLRISSNALNTTAHNITNADTDGYTRQQVSLVTSSYNTVSKTEAHIGWTQLGMGVTYAETRQVRDYFLDTNYRKENGRSDFYTTSVDALNQVEDILGESTGGESFSTSMENLWTAVEELVKDPCNEVNQNLLVTRSYEFITQAGNVYNSLCDYQQNLNITIKNTVNTINDLAHRLEDLNIAIMKIESGGVEHANDLRDERNFILDQLSGFGYTSWDEDLDGYVSVQIEGTDLVKGGLVHEMGLYQDPQTNFYSVFWTQNAKYTYNADGERVVDPASVAAAQVFDLTRPISSDLNTDIGSLKAALYARGDRNATFKDVVNEEIYNKDVSKSVMMNIEAEFDLLIHNITTSINQIFSDAAERATESYPGTDYLRNEDGSYIQLFNLKVNDTTKGEVDYGPELNMLGIFDTSQVVKLTDLINTTTPQYSDSYYVDKINNIGTYTDEQIAGVISLMRENYQAGFTTSNIEINMALRQSPSTLGFRLPDGSEDNATMLELSKAFNEEVYTLNPNVTTPLSFKTFYNSMVSQVSTSGSVYTVIKDAQDQTLNSINSAREQIHGVNNDEELTFMIQFQNAYNAASRYINVVDEMLEHLVNTLGS